MPEFSELPSITKPRLIAIKGATLIYGNIEAWINIIESYRQIHPQHQVSILHYGEPVNNLTSLYKRQKRDGSDEFHMVVTAPDKELKDVPKLFRLLVDGAGPDFRRFIHREAFKVLELF